MVDVTTWFRLAYPKIFSATSIDALFQWRGSAARDPSGMISFDLTGNQERGLGKQRVEKLGQTTQWMMAGLYLCLWLDARPAC